MKKLILILSSFILLSVASAQSGQVRGVVIDKKGEPLVGATILIPQLNKGAYTNDLGIYSLSKIPQGTYQIMALYVGYDTLFEEVVVPKGIKSVNKKLVLEEHFLNEVEINAHVEGKIETKQVKLAEIEITAKDINLMPSIGAPDLMQYLQVLPGVVFTGDQGGKVYIRGGTPIQNMTVLDGMVLYSPFHSIGLFSVFDPDFIRKVDVFSAGFPGQYGGRISSVIDIKTRNGDFENLSGKVNINPFSTNILFEGPLSRSRKSGGGVSFLTSLRKNYIDKTSPVVYPYVNDSLGLPYNFTDFYGKLTLSDGINVVNLFGFNHNDNVNYDFPANINWTASGGGANFMMLPQGASVIIRGNFSSSKYNTSLLSQSENFPRESSISGFNGGLNMSYIINSIDAFNAGISFLGFTTKYKFTNSFGFVTDPGKVNNTEASFFMKYKKVIQTKVKPGSKTPPRDLMVIEPSVHTHYYNDQAHVSFEPRLRFKLNLPRLSFSAAYGQYKQNLMAAVSDRDVVNLFQGFLSAPTEDLHNLQGERVKNNLQTATHLVGGVEVELASRLTTQVEAWSKKFPQLTNINRDKIFPTDDNFVLEEGNAYGFDLLLRYNSPELYLYATYGWAKVERTDPLRVYPTIFDRRHTVNLVGALRLKRFDYVKLNDRKVAPKFKEHAWEFSARWTLGSGFPFTQTQGFYEKLDFPRGTGSQTDIPRQNGQLGLLLSEDLNGGRLPYYHRMDLSAKRRWLIKNAWLIEANFSLVNTYDRKNIFYFDRVAFAPVYQLPVLPSLGLTIRY